MGNFILGFICCFILIALLVAYSCLVVSARESRREEMRAHAMAVTDVSPPPDIEPRAPMHPSVIRYLGSRV